MAKIMKKEIYWNTVPEATPGEIVAYHVYFAPEGTPFTYLLPYISVPAIQPQSETQNVIAPDDFPEGTFLEDTPTSIWITPVDAEGNEPDPFKLSHPFDFTPPQPVVSGGVRDYPM